MARTFNMRLTDDDEAALDRLRDHIPGMQSYADVVRFLFTSAVGQLADYVPAARKPKTPAPTGLQLPPGKRTVAIGERKDTWNPIYTAKRR